MLQRKNLLSFRIFIPYCFKFFCRFSYSTNIMFDNKVRQSAYLFPDIHYLIPILKPLGEIRQTCLQTGIYLLTLLTFPYFQGFPPLKILYMYPFPLFLPLWDNYKGKFIIQLFNRCLPLYQEVLRKSALLPL